ncbi:NAT10 [Bugula neritina]|uniref:RNA cytidine acetyltransferase n=1 Tax=Bugula neritina TaxID=10212 RepID=A0A7J7J672_BUGNE|nr:NAT10 [Bugula neritina]
MRSMFVVVGERAMDQVVVLHHMMSKAAVKARPTVLWCYKKDPGFNSNRSKRLRGIQKKIKTGNISTRKEDMMDLFTLSTAIQYCHYKDTHKILGNTYGMCVLQDFEALTPNLLAHTIETVEGGGVIVLLLKKVESLQQLYTMTMDVHSRYRTAANLEVTPRFNERFILSLKECANCLVTDDELNILPISSAAANIMSLSSKHVADLLSGNRGKFSQVRQSPTEKEKDGALINCCKTIDQKTLSSTVALTAARGRGKSAALGLAVASAVAYGYSNMFVTSPTPENLKTLFEFILKGLDSLGYVKHTDYDIVQSTNEEFNKAIVRVNIYRDHRQTIQYIHPTDAHKLGQAELVVIDEAAAIPLPLVKSLMGPHLVFMASTINGYEGTGRSLSLKLIKQLREQATTTSSGCPPLELTLKEPIRYAEGDLVEAWLNQLLCLDATEVENINCGDPLPERCDLYYVNRDALFSFHKTSEEFLQKIMSLYVSSHYKNTPNDLQMLSDSPSHHIFVLLAPEVSGKTLPEVLVVLQQSLLLAILFV